MVARNGPAWIARTRRKSIPAQRGYTVYLHYAPCVFGPTIEPIRSPDSAKAQLENLNEGTLAQLLAILAETKQGGAPAN